MNPQTLQSFNARTGEPHGNALAASTMAELDAVVNAAADASPSWASSSGGDRATLLRALADSLEAEREALVALADTETALGPVRLNGELDRTCFQLRRFATLAGEGAAFRLVDDPAVAGGPPAGHPDMQRQWVPLGPVAMFAASNFPFAFSVLGGDTASALAAGCPVVVKAHPGHPLLSQQTYTIIQAVLARLKLPAGLVGMVQGAGVHIGVALIRHPRIAAGAFTGSTRGGLALLAEAQARAVPIPFYGELGAINPVVVTPAALGANTEALADTLASSITLGCGQFCTNPGLIVLPAHPDADRLVTALKSALASQQPHAMLTAGMRQAFAKGTARQLGHGARALVNDGADASVAPMPFLAEVDAARLVAEPELREEVFGPSSLLVRTRSLDEIEAVLRSVQGSLTVTLLGVDADTSDNRRLVRAATAIAGRVLFKGVPTGVAVTAAQQHGGPWPASTAPMTTSVGDAALERFVRPVCLQDAPAWLKERHGQPC
ncbi:aldehyde dehydrogenase (NADP(+)) [Hydrogenophaga sp. 5NK40-0174]|uniref:aldehyde dehydrogenase (NADP(+)) n=1 Tax=Hydrogenophaga sp. 5NK40-0174 TaxID=3127649 RepID=UPI003105BB27